MDCCAFFLSPFIGFGTQTQAQQPKKENCNDWLCRTDTVALYFASKKTHPMTHTTALVITLKATSGKWIRLCNVIQHRWNEICDTNTQNCWQIYSWKLVWMQRKNSTPNSRMFFILNNLEIYTVQADNVKLGW